MGIDIQFELVVIIVPTVTFRMLFVWWSASVLFNADWVLAKHKPRQNRIWTLDFQLS